VDILTTSDKQNEKGTRTLELPESINFDFNDIKSFGNFKRYFGRNYFHSFYSMGIALAVNDQDFLKNIKDLNNDDFNFNPRNEKMINSIDNPQLLHHDFFFKIIAYWVLMKKNDSDCYRVIKDTDLARRICEEIFIRYWDDYKEYLINLVTKYPNVVLVDNYKEVVLKE